MEQHLADLLSDAFSETSVPSLLDGDFDFENLNFDEKLEDKTGIAHENLPTKEDEALQQEAGGQTAALSSMETRDTYMAETADEEQSDEEDFQGVGVTRMDKTPEEDYTSSDGDSEPEGSVSGENEEDEEEDTGTEGELFVPVCCGDEFCDGDKEDRIYAEGQPLAPEGAEKPQVRNEEQGDSERDKEVFYFKRVPERGSEMMTKGDGIEEDEQEREEGKRREEEDWPDSECEDMKIEQEENVLTQFFEQEVENPSRDGLTRDSLEFPEISVQNLQDLIAEVDKEGYAEKMKDFSGEEHQEAGESFADYPSDLSSCEYVVDGNKNQGSSHQSTAKQNTYQERAVTDITWTGRAGDTGEEGDEYLYSIDLELDADKFRSLDVATGEKDRGTTETVEHMLDDVAVTGCDDGGETGESDSYSSSDDEVHVKRSHGELLFSNMQDLENNRRLEELHGGSNAAFFRWSTSDDYNSTLLSEDLLTTEDTDRAETLLSGASSKSVVQTGDTKTTSPSNQGSLDDSFFFRNELEAPGTTEQGQLGDDEYEEERNWEQEQERIKAFYDFYDDSDEENGREGREIKVQFCTDPLSQVIHYETDSSDRDSLSSSTDREEDLSSAETSEELREPDDTTQMKPACGPPNCQLPETAPDLSNAPNCTRKHKCLNLLKLILKMGVVIVMGLLMFWLATDQGGWLSQGSSF